MTLPSARTRHLAQLIHNLGPYPLAHLLHELEQGADVHARCEKYAALPANFIKQHRGDGVPNSIRLVSA